MTHNMGNFKFTTSSQIITRNEGFDKSFKSKQVDEFIIINLKFFRPKSFHSNAILIFIKLKIPNIQENIYIVYISFSNLEDCPLIYTSHFVYYIPWKFKFFFNKKIWTQTNSIMIYNYSQYILSNKKWG